MKAKNITPKGAQCGLGPACPAIFQTDRGTYVIVGSIPAMDDLPRNIRKKVGKGETAVEIPDNVLP